MSCCPWSQTGQSGKELDLDFRLCVFPLIERLAEPSNLSTLMKSSEVCKVRRIRGDVLRSGWRLAGRSPFSYAADPSMGLKPGDLVRVRLRGRAMHGLVVEEREWAVQDPQELQLVNHSQRAAVDSDWYSWLEWWRTVAISVSSAP